MFSRTRELTQPVTESVVSRTNYGFRGLASRPFKEGTPVVEKESRMADQRYEIDSEGNLVQSGEGSAAQDSADQGSDAQDQAVQDSANQDPAATGGEATGDRPVSAADRRRFLNALIASDVIGVLVLGGSGLLLPESRTLLLALAVLYAVAGIAIYIWMSRMTQRKVEEGRERQANG
jgi:hypothetical protein